MKSSIEQWNSFVDSCHGSGSVDANVKILRKKLHFFILFDFSRRLQHRPDKFESAKLWSLKSSIQRCYPRLTSCSGSSVIGKNKDFAKKTPRRWGVRNHPQKKIPIEFVFFSRLKRPRILLSKPILFSLESSIQRYYPLFHSCHGQRVTKILKFWKKSKFSVYRLFDPKSKIQGDSPGGLSYLSTMKKKSRESVKPSRRSFVTKEIR